MLETGGRWHGYEIEEAVSGARVMSFEATRVSSMEHVMISATPLTKDIERRREVWALLSKQLHMDASILGCSEVIEEEGWRYEVMDRPPPMILREWIACNKPDAWTLKHMLQQLAAAVSALHSQNLVHLNIRPDVIYLEDRGDRMGIVLGGLDCIMLHAKPQLGPNGIDPFYAAPEAVEPDWMKSGVGLRAWDWWGLGRVMQELVLGHHVMNMIFGCDVIKGPTPELRERALALLAEREPPGVRAGAVETMVGVSDAMTKVMLRGLLTTARDARWSGDAVGRWLEKMKVSDHYDLARNYRLFSWKERSFTLMEAIEFFRTEENWPAGEENISNPDNAATLAHFLSVEPLHQQDWQKLQQVYAQMELPEWSCVSPTARRSITTAVSWLVLEPRPGSLIIQGRRMEAKGLGELLERSQDTNNCSLVLGLISAPCLSLIRALDPVAGQVLAHLAEVGSVALQAAEQYKWVDPEDTHAQAQVLRLALESGGTLRSRVDKMRAIYATSSDPELAKLLAERKSAPWVNVLLVLTGAEPQRYGYVTKEEHRRQHLDSVQMQCRKLRATVFWRRLRNFLLAGGSCTGEGTSFVVLCVGLALLGLTVAHDAETTVWLVLALAVLRLLLVWRVRVLALRWDPVAAPWQWRNGPARCLTEIQRVWPEETTSPLAELSRQLMAAEAMEASLLSVEHKKSRLAPSELMELWFGLVVAACVCVLGSIQLVQSYGSIYRLPSAGTAHGYPGVVAATALPNPGAAATPVKSGQSPVTETPPDPLLKIPGITPEILEQLKRGEYEIVKDAFGESLHGPILKWDTAIPGVLPSLPVVGRITSTPAQRAYARVSGELLLIPYGHVKINALLAVRVPVQDGFGLMLYNAREHRLIDSETLLLRGQLTDRTWYKLDRKKVINLGLPEGMPDENSLALQ